MKNQKTTRRFALLPTGLFALCVAFAAHGEPSQSSEKGGEHASMRSSRTRVSVNINLGSSNQYNEQCTTSYYGAPIYNSRVVYVPTYGYPTYGYPTYGYPAYGYPNGGNTVVVINNGTTIINNGGGYGYPYNYPVVISPQFYNYGPNGITPAAGWNGASSNVTRPVNTLPASSYYFDPSLPSNNHDNANWPSWDYQNSVGNFSNLSSSRPKITNRDSKRNDTNANVTDVKAVDSNANDATTQALKADDVKTAQWADGAVWSANDDGTLATIPTWPSDEKATSSR